MRHIKTGVILTALLILSVGDLVGQIEIGIYAGPSMLNFSGDNPRFSVYKPGIGLLAGAILDFPLSEDIRLSLQPGYGIENARSQTADTAYYYFIKKLEYRDSIYFRMDHLILPVIIKVLSDNQRFQFTSGLEFNYQLNIRADNGKEKFNLNDEYKRFNVSARFGLGYIIPLNTSHLSLNLQYVQSLANWSNSDQETSFFPRVKTNGLRFAIGWTIPVSRKNHQEP